MTLTLVPGAIYLPVVGASASCAGLIGLYAVHYYRSSLALVGVPFRLSVVYVVAIYVGFECLSGIYGAWRGELISGVAHWAHMGGFLTGLLGGQWLGLGEAGRSAYLKEDASRAMEHSRPGEAIRRYERVLQREPENGKAMTELCRAWLLLGDREQAAIWEQRALDRLLLSGQRAEASRFYAAMQAEELPPVALSRPSTLLLGGALEEQEYFDLAVQCYLAVSQNEITDEESETALLKAAGLLAQRLKRYPEAMGVLQRFLRLYPLSQFRGMAEQLQQQIREQEAD